MNGNQAYSSRPDTAGEEKRGGIEVSLTKMQKTFMKSSMTMRKQKNASANPGATSAAPDNTNNNTVQEVEVLDAAAYSELMSEVERPSKYVSHCCAARLHLTPPCYSQSTTLHYISHALTPAPTSPLLSSPPFPCSHLAVFA